MCNVCTSSLLALIGCTPLSCTYTAGDPNSPDKNVCYRTNNTDSSTKVKVKLYTCYVEDYKLSGENGSYRILRNRSYSESTTLFYGTGEQVVYHLCSKNTHRQFRLVCLGLDGSWSLCPLRLSLFFCRCDSLDHVLDCDNGGDYE